MAQFELDVRRLLCPMPVIKTQQKVKQLADGDELSVFATDPGALQDIPAWSRMFGHDVLDIQETPCEVMIRLKVNHQGDSQI